VRKERSHWETRTPLSDDDIRMGYGPDAVFTGDGEKA
jgi:hypothetical protein